jgi:hypothetical protein
MIKIDWDDEVLAKTVLTGLSRSVSSRGLGL